jgi:hypothetical protein
VEKELKYNKVNLKTFDSMRFLPFVFIISYWHSCASLLLANGVSLKQIQEWLGHSSFKITADTYAHLDYESKIAAANAMSWVNETSLGSNSLENRLET